MDQIEIKYFLEAALLAAGRPLNIDHLQGLFDGRMAPEKSELRTAIAALNDDYAERGIVVSEVASGFRMQVKTAMADRLHCNSPACVTTVSLRPVKKSSTTARFRKLFLIKGGE